MWRFLIPVVLVAALVGFFYVGLYRDPSAIPSPFIGKSAPLFTRPAVEDPARTVSIKDFIGKPFVLNIWGTWCVECRYEHAVLLELSRRGTVPIVGLNWKDELEPAQEWLKQLGNPYAATAFDKEGTAGIDWGAYGAPETFLIDARGTVIYKFVSPLTMEVWEKEFLPRLAKSQAAQR